MLTSRAQGQGIVAVRPSILKGAMSALGQKPTCAAQKGMSALHPKAIVKADIRNGSCLLYP